MSLTFSDGQRIIRNRIRITPSTTVDVAAVDKPGSNLNIIAAVAGELMTECDSRSAGRCADLVTPTARDDALDRLVDDDTFSKLARKGPSAAVFTVNISRTAAPGGTIPAGTIMLAGGLTYTLDEAVVFATNNLGPLPANFTCATLGTAGNLAPSAIQGFKEPGLLWDSTLAITGLDGESGYATGGDEREGDADYRSRRAAFDAGLDRNLEFLAAGALGVAGIKFATAIEDLDSDGNPVGTVTLYVADVNGRANAGLVKRVRAAIRGFRLNGQHVPIVGASPTYVEIELHFAIKAGFDQAQVQAEVVAAVVAYVNALPPGATLTLAGLAAVIQSVAGVVLEPATPYGVVSPSADTAPTSAATLFRTRAELVTFS